jgi:Tol biopolymer transport system component
LWIDSGPEQIQISDRADAILSPDGTRHLYEEKTEGNLDIWLGDRVADHRLNLTNTPERVESNPQWWPGRLDTVLFDSRASDSPVGPGTPAFLTMVHLDGTDYQVLDGQNGVGCTLAPSPDGQTIAYGSGRTAWLYDMDTGPEVFDPTSYGLESAGEMVISSPAWSPDGSLLAWVLTGVLVEGESLYHGVGIFDLQRRSATVFRGSQSDGGGVCPPRPVWSPDGGWLAFESWANSPDERGLWVVSTGGQGDGAELLRGSSPVWGPDGRWLAFRGSEAENWIVQPGSWRPLALALPTDALVVDWIDLSRN